MRRTRRLLREALIALMRERGSDRVSVQEICARADVGRSTFYTHFADRSELLLSGFDELGAELDAEQAPLGFVGGLIAHVDAHRDLRRALGGSRVRVQRRLHRLVLDRMTLDLARLTPSARGRDVSARFLTGALLELSGWWIDGGGGLSAAELEAQFRRLSGPVLEQLRADPG